MSIDYRTLLADAIDNYVGTHGSGSFYEPHAAAILATRTPDLCPDCDQGDVKHLPYSQTCTHLNAPTIADLLRWGENVAKWEWADEETGDQLRDTRSEAQNSMLFCLRTEADR